MTATRRMRRVEGRGSKEASVVKELESRVRICEINVFCPPGCNDR